MLADKPEVLTISEVAEILQVSAMTLRRWDNAGILKAFRPHNRTKRRYKKYDIVAFMDSRPSK